MRLSSTSCLLERRRRPVRLAVAQEQFAQKVGVTYSTVNHWENGKRAPPPFLVRRLLELKKELDEQNAKPPRKKSPR
jgi:DNA-binding transcriptional regulator YiaG